MTPPFLTVLNGFLEFSNYAKLCTFEHAWSTAEEERRIGMSRLLISDSPWQVCGKSVEVTSPSSNWSSSNWSKF